MKRTPKNPTLAEAIRLAAKLSNAEARFVVSDYYASQEARKRVDMQLRHLGEGGGGNDVLLNYMAEVYGNLEKEMAKVLAVFVDTSAVGRWIVANHGIGPIIAAGMLAHLDITRAPTAGHFWSFSGLNPAQKWEKGQKRPYNAAMKQLCFHLGECVKRTYKSPDSFYGRIYESRKKLLVARNAEGFNAERAKTFTTKSADVKKKLADGLLPDGNLDRQACNYVAKIFLSHLHAIMYWDNYKQPPPKPFALSILGHAHEIRIPHADMFPGFEDAYYGQRFLQAAE